jgi:hypothetical protein
MLSHEDNEIKLKHNMEVIRRISPERVLEIQAYIQTHLFPLATTEQAKCARGRLNLWLQAEPNYSTRKYKPAHSDQRLWRFCQKIYPEAALAQIYFATHNHGIDWHRDASYAQPNAFIFNLGQVCLQTRTEDGKLIELELTGGEIIRFNCKLPHRSIPRNEDRIGIGIWRDAIDIKNPKNWQ